MASSLRKLWHTACLALLSVLVASAAAAQTPSPLAYWQNTAGVVLMPLAGPMPEWQGFVGGGVMVEPAYEGSHYYRVLPAPAFDIRYRDVAFLSSGDGLGVNLIHGASYRAGVALAYDIGREHNLVGRLAGLGNVSPAPEFKLFAEAALLPFIFSGNIRRAIGGHNGVIGDLGAYMPVAGNERLVVFVGPGVTFANSRYMQSYFGISTTQSAASIFPRYDAQGGMKNANFGIAGIYRLTDHWLLDGDIGVERLLGAAANSPIVQERYQLGVALLIGYQF